MDFQKARAGMVARSPSAGGRSFSTRGLDTLRSRASFGEVDIQPVTEPSTIPLGGSRAFEYDIQGDSQEHDAFDEDFCISPELVGGIDVDIVAEAGGDQVAGDSACLSNAPLSRTPHTFSFSLEGATAGSFPLRIAVIGSTSRNVLAERTVSITVTDDSDGGDGDGGGATPGDDDGGGGNGGGESIFEQAAILLVLFIISLIALGAATD